MIIKKSKSAHLRSWIGKDGKIIPLFYKIKAKFPLEARQYYGGSWDGDGYHRLRQKRKHGRKHIDLTLEMAEDGCEPVLKLAHIFDLSIVYIKRSGKKYKNYQPTFRCTLAGLKAEMFLLLTYPFIVFRRPSVRKLLLERGIPEKFLTDPISFSWPYLAGFADAEGTPYMKLHHETRKFKKGPRTYSNYSFRFSIPNNDFSSLDFIKNKIIEAGFNFRKDYIHHYDKVPITQRMRLAGGNPANWKPCKTIYVAGGPAELSQFYENFYNYSLIKKKKNIMRRTMNYNSLMSRLPLKRNETK